MRAEPTPLEEKLWQALRASQLNNLKFSRQIVLQGFICDFVCRNLRLVIEIDGDTHERARDAERDFALGRAGYHVLRFMNSDIGNNLDGVLAAIREAAAGRPSKLDLLDGLTHPQPLPWQGGE
ncbi:endonuclease domain-containing protein [Rhizorhabdus argentea]|uniref:endonuclease domain-containing protein n=1 Tax=Rhizorhabdus argentea TaxID=1387174 RepID=UPI0030EBD0CB